MIWYLLETNPRIVNVGSLIDISVLQSLNNVQVIWVKHTNNNSCLCSQHDTQFILYCIMLSCSTLEIAVYF
jgi:hypothetical protein